MRKNETIQRVWIILPSTINPYIYHIIKGVFLPMSNWQWHKRNHDVNTKSNMLLHCDVKFKKSIFLDGVIKYTMVILTKWHISLAFVVRGHTVFCNFICVWCHHIREPWVAFRTYAMCILQPNKAYGHSRVVQSKGGARKLKAKLCGLMAEARDLEAVDAGQTANAQSLTQFGWRYISHYT